MSTPATLESVIESTASDIYDTLTDAVDEDLQERIDEWCGLHGLERLEDPQQIVANQAAFNVLLKSTLYEHYRQHTDLPELDGDVQAAFKTAGSETDDPAFDAYVLDDVARLGDPAALEEIVDARLQLASSEDPAEEIGRLFETLVPQEARRKLGQFRTPPTIASLMASWLIDDGTERVLDPGMGACALSAAAYATKQSVVDSPPLADIYGIDLNELALVMGATALNLQNHGGPHNLQIGDFLDFAPEDVDGEVDAIISNPPYTRHQELSEEYKETVNDRVETELGRSVSSLSPMYAYFYYHTTEFISPGGKLSFITPSEFLETSYGESLKKYLVDTYDIKALVLFDRDEQSKFEEAMTTSLVSFLEKPEGEVEELTRIIRVDEDPDEDELLEAIEGEVEGETEWGFINVVQQAGLEADNKWTNLFDPLEIDTSELTEFSELATVNRGIATGMNDYFCLTQDVVDEWDIDEQYLSKIIRNSRSVPGYDYQPADWELECDEGGEVWLLYHLTELDADSVRPTETDGDTTLSAFTEHSDGEEKTPTVVDYLEYGMSEEVGADSGYLAKNRTPWYVVDRRDPPPILVTYMSRGGSRFIKNETDARNLSNLHGIYLNVELSDQEVGALLAYLNSEFASEVVRRSGRTYSSGMDKIEPNEMEGVPVLDPRNLDDETISELAGLFDELRATAREDADTVEEVIERIDDRLESEL